MSKPFSDVIKGFPRPRRARIAVRGKELIREEMTLRELRKVRKLTQSELSEILGIGQEHVSRLEKRGDMLLSTLTKYVRAMGGDLEVTATFPGLTAIKLADLAPGAESRSGASGRRTGKGKKSARVAA